MPIENELKFELYPNRDLLNFLNEKKENQINVYNIVQYYDTEIRIRKKTNIKTKETKYWFTWKKLLTCNGNIEIEKEISERDFNIIKNETNAKDTYLTKDRYCIPDLFLWEIDIIPYKNNPDSIFMILAEVELPENIKELKLSTLPFFIKDNIKNIVKQGDSNYSNYSLAKKL